MYEPPSLEVNAAKRIIQKKKIYILHLKFELTFKHHPSQNNTLIEMFLSQTRRRRRKKMEALLCTG